jgi:hypothetical protein
MKKWPNLFSDRFVPVFLLVVCLLSFGLLLPWLGFYWDDWAKILVARLGSLPDYLRYYAEDRPLSAWTHMLFTPLLGTTPLPWHIFTLLLRWLSAWGAWWCLNLIWPSARRQNLAAALIFLVYPVFVSQPAAVTFHQQWLQYALFFLSFGLMLLARRRSGRTYWGLSAGALLAMLAQLSVTEYFITLEFLRPLALFFLFQQPEPGTGATAPMRISARRALRAWTPYLLVTAGFIVWRLFFIKLSGEDPYHAETLYALLETPLATLRQMLGIIWADSIEILFNSWFRNMPIQTTHASRLIQLIYIVGLAAAGLIALFMIRYQPVNASTATSTDRQTARRWLGQALIFGLVAVLLGPLPAWITGRQVVFDFHSDRYAMPAMFGAAVLVAALLEWLLKQRVPYSLVLGLLVGFMLVFHLKTANDYRWIWNDEQRFFWELSWRAPSLETPTALFLEEEPFPNQGLFSTSAALNLMYPQPEGGQNMGYWVYSLRPRYNQPPSSLNIGLNTTFRTLHFEGETPNSLLLYKKASIGNCLWLLNARDVEHPHLPALIKGFLPISNLERIRPELARPGYPPTDILGAEPPHTDWCYYFEKADLARQQEDWDSVIALADGALDQGYWPDQFGSNSPYEWLPLIEGLVHGARWETARDVTLAAYKSDKQYAPMLCTVWYSTAISGGEEILAEVDAALGCNRP